MDFDVIIIGAGMSGLAAGIRLAYYDLKVCILEKHSLWGGLNSFYRKKYRFDVGLHALTNYVPKGVRNAPLTKLLRQLRLKHEDFDLHEQSFSQVCFQDRSLKFTNDFSVFDHEVMERFPVQTDGWQKLVKAIEEFDELALDYKPVSARTVVESYISDPILVDMLFCPLTYYGSAREQDMDWDQFVVMFKSIFKEGFARPHRGVRQILELLIAKYKELGGTLKLKSGVEQLRIEDGRVKEVVIEGGEVLTAKKIISSAGLVETLRMIPGYEPGKVDLPGEVGVLTFMESISILDREPKSFGFEPTIIFFNNGERFNYRRPQEALDVSSGVLCCPNNYKFDTPLEYPAIRITNLANFDRWASLPEDAYREAKQEWYRKSVDAVLPYIPDFRQYMVYNDTFTPRTIHHFTGHINGAVYGAPRKVKDGRTHLDNLFLCGTDQGFLGIVGAMLSGITMANVHVLQENVR